MKQELCMGYLKPLTEALGYEGAPALTEGDGYWVATFADVKGDPLPSCAAFWARNGFYAEEERTVHGNLFRVYASDRVRVHVSWYPSKQLLKIALEDRGYAPIRERPHTDAVCTPSIVQLGRCGASERLPNGAPGMSYVLQTAAGGFLLVDGGPLDRERADVDQLWEYLLQNKPAHCEKPHILAWFITHSHHDHIHLAIEFLKTYGDRIVLDTVAYNFPPFASITIKHEDAARMGAFAEEFQALAAALGANTLLLHTGQRFWLEDAMVEVLYTPDDFAPAAYPWGNHTSCAFRFTLGGKTFLVLGDCEKGLCQFMADVYGETMKSDILQLSHHGVNGACLELYQAVDPDVCFWPIDEFRFFNHAQIRGEKAWDFNRWILDDAVKARSHFHTSITTVLTLSGNGIQITAV